MQKIGVQQQQIHNILFNREIGWHEIIYDLINTEQLNPWDINITILTSKYLEKIQNLEESDFFISSKVLLAASLLLRIKSEILLNKYIKSIDEILFGKKEKSNVKLERIELDEEIPELIPRSPIPRFKKVTLKELIASLNKAITTENRRIKKEILNKNALRESSISLPKRKFRISDRIKIISKRLINYFENNRNEKTIKYNNLITKKEKILSFEPLFHLEHQKKIWLEQKKHFGDIYIWERKNYIKCNGYPYADLKNDNQTNI
jgi:segregation and condensation protein A